MENFASWDGELNSEFIWGTAQRAEHWKDLVFLKDGLMHFHGMQFHFQKENCSREFWRSQICGLQDRAHSSRADDTYRAGEIQSQKWVLHSEDADPFIFTTWKWASVCCHSYLSIR